MNRKKLSIDEIKEYSNAWARERGITGDVIGVFRGTEYNFLCNFYNADVTINGVTFANNESAFQAFKCWDRVHEFIGLSPDDAKKLGRRVRLRPDWEDVKEQVLYDVVFAKFSGNDELKRRLLATGDVYLIEGNYWKDTHWGVFKGRGKNKLGDILMTVRSDLRNGGGR